MSVNKTGLIAAAGLTGLLLWRNAGHDTKQGIIEFLSQIPAAIEDAERRRVIAEHRTRISEAVPESVPLIFDERVIAEILADLNWNQQHATAEQSVSKITDATLPIEPAIDPETPWHETVSHPSAVLIIGKKGSGKSALAYRLLELFRFRADVYAVGLPGNAADLLPKWIGTVDSLKELPIGSTAIVDEAHLRYNSRNSHSNDSRSISEALNLCRQRGQTIIVISQEARQIDKNIASSTDVIIFKEPAMLQIEFERRELRVIVEKAVLGFRTVKGSKQTWSYVHSPGADFIGMLENRLPGFWSEKLSRAFASGISTATNRIPSKTTVEEKRQQAQELRLAGRSYSEIARVLSVSKTTAINYVKGYPYQS